MKYAVALVAVLAIAAQCWPQTPEQFKKARDDYRVMMDRAKQLSARVDNEDQITTAMIQYVDEAKTTAILSIREVKAAQDDLISSMTRGIDRVDRFTTILRAEKE